MTILMLETIDDEAMALLEAAGPVIVSPSPDAHQHDLPFADVTAIITRGLGQIDRALINKCPNLKVIARCGAGLNNLDIDAAAENNISVVFAPGINASAVSEQTLMLMLMIVRQGFTSASEVKTGNWNVRNKFAGDDLAGKKVCIVGGGKIGNKVAGLCRAMSMEVTICSRDGNGLEGLEAALSQNLPKSDIVSLHIPLTADTHQLFDQTVLAMIKPSAVLINTARGELVESKALIAALDSGALTGYGADVIEGETPASGDPVIGHAKTVVTPHVAAMTKRTYKEMSCYTAENVLAVLTGSTPEPASLYLGAA
jgi:D-3-phosphoglycerate dehydrogenase